MPCYHADRMSKPKPLVLVDHPLLADLTPRQRAFVTHPLVSSNPRQAWLDSGYAQSDTNPYIAAKQLLDYIQHYERQRLAKHEITADSVKEELAAVGYSDLGEYLDEVDTDTGTITFLKDIKRLPPRMRKAIKNLNFVPPYTDAAGNLHPATYEVELWNKVEALRELAKCLGISNPKKPMDPKDGLQPDQAQLLEQMTEEELRAINSAFMRAGQRVSAVRSKKKDANAITVEKDE